MDSEAISTEKRVEEVQRERDAENEVVAEELAEREKKIEELQRELESARAGESEKKEGDQLHVSTVEVEKMQTVITEMRAQKQLDDIRINQYDHAVEKLTAANKELEERVMKAHLEGRNVQEAIMKMREGGVDGQKDERGVLDNEQVIRLDEAQSQIVQLNKVVEQVQQWRSESHARVIELETEVKTLQKSNDDLMRKEKSGNQKTVQNEVQILQRREDKARIRELEKKVENQKNELKAWKENVGSKMKNNLKVTQEKVSRLKNAMQTSEAAHRKSLEEAEEKIRGLEKKTLCECKGDGEKKTNPGSTATQEEIQILQCTRDGDRIRELEEKVKEMQRTIDDFQKKEKSNNVQDDVQIIQSTGDARIRELEKKVKNQKMTINTLQGSEDSKALLKKKLRAAVDKAKYLKNAMRTSEEEYRKSLAEAEEKIRGLEKRRRCDCEGDGEKKSISDDLEEEVQKMRDAVRKNQEIMTALSSVIVGEISLARVEGCTVTSQPGLVQKIKSLEEMCHLKDSVIDAMKNRAIITEYELVQLRDIVRLNAREPLGVV